MDCGICRRKIHQRDPHLYSNFVVPTDEPTTQSQYQPLDSYHLICWQIRQHIAEKNNVTSSHTEQTKKTDRIECICGCNTELTHELPHVAIPSYAENNRFEKMNYLHFGCFFVNFNSTYTICMNQTRGKRRMVISKWENEHMRTDDDYESRTITSESLPDEKNPAVIDVTDFDIFNVIRLLGEKQTSVSELEKERLAGRIKCAPPSIDIVSVLSTYLAVNRENRIYRDSYYASAYTYMAHSKIELEDMITLGLKIHHVVDRDGRVDWKTIFSKESKFNASNLAKMGDTARFTEMLIKGMPLNMFMNAGYTYDHLAKLRFNYKAYVAAGGNENDKVIDVNGESMSLIEFIGKDSLNKLGFNIS